MLVWDQSFFVLPGFDVLAVELRHIRIKGTSKIGNEQGTYDIFIKNDLSLSRMYPCELLLKEVTVVKVNINLSIVVVVVVLCFLYITHVHFKFNYIFSAFKGGRVQAECHN